MKDCLNKIANSNYAQRGMREWRQHTIRNAALFVLLPILLSSPHTYLVLGISATVAVTAYTVATTTGWWARCLST